MSDRVDNDWCRRQIVYGARGHDSLQAAAIAGSYIEPTLRDVVTHCAPYARKMSGRLVKLPGSSRIDPADLESAALWGLSEGVQSYRLSKGVAVSTHVTIWIRKRVLEVRYHEHWVVARPPEELAADYMAGRLDAAQHDAYIDRFVRHTTPSEHSEDYEGPHA